MNKKIFFSLIIVLLLTFSFVACGSGEDKNYSFDPQDMANYLVEKGSYEDKLDSVKKSILNKNYPDLDDDVKCSLYMSSAATAEEAGVFICNDSKEADKVYEICKKRLDSLKETYKSYAPKEVLRIDNNTVLDKKNNLVVLCISNDKKLAQENIDNYLSNIKG